MAEQRVYVIRVWHAVVVWALLMLVLWATR